MRIPKQLRPKVAEEVRRLIAEGKSYREIERDGITVNGQIFYQSLASIHKLAKTETASQPKTEMETQPNVKVDKVKVETTLSPAGVSHSDGLNVNVSDGDFAAEVFKKLRQGMSPANVVINLHADPDVVLGLYQKYVKMTSHENPLCDKDYDKGYESGYENGKEEIKDAYKFPCSICGKPARLDAEAWQAVLKSGALKSWAHGDCLEKKRVNLYKEL